jgi:L-malate glycosyltransferase
MRIGYIIDNLHIGGAQRLLLNLCEELKARDDISISIIGLSDDQEKPFPEKLLSLGARVYHFPRTARRETLDFGRYRDLKRFIIEQRLDIIHTQLQIANIVGVIAGNMAHRPVVSSLQNQLSPFQEVDFLAQFLETQSLRLGAAEIIAVGHTVAETQKKRFRGRKLQIIPNVVTQIPGISPIERQETREELIGDASRPLLISVGRMRIQKGFDDLIDTFLIIREKEPDTALMIVGDGILEDHLRKRVKDLGLENHIYLPGKRNDVPRLLAASDLYVSSSLWEGLSLAILEAMSAGLPVVVTDVGDSPYIITPEMGIVTPAHQPKTLAAAVLEMLDDPDRMRKVGQICKTFIDENYRTDIWIEHLLTLYKNVLQAGQNQNTKGSPS